MKQKQITKSSEPKTGYSPPPPKKVILISIYQIFISQIIGDQRSGLLFCFRNFSGKISNTTPALYWIITSCPEKKRSKPTAKMAAPFVTSYKKLIKNFTLKNRKKVS